jgi:hypothetical protein
MVVTRDAVTVGVLSWYWMRKETPVSGLKNEIANSCG